MICSKQFLCYTKTNTNDTNKDITRSRCLSNVSKHIIVLNFYMSIFFSSTCNATITVYCHGVGADSEQINDYKEQILDPYQTVTFSDTQAPRKHRNKFIATNCERIGRKYINREQMYLGQGKDIETLAQQISINYSYILFGLCRGGMAIINYLAQYNPSNIQAIVLDETPADIADIIQKMQHRCKPLKLFSIETIIRQCFPAYPKKCSPPVDNIRLISNKQLPIFLCYANKPTTFHFPESTWKNYCAFKKAGFCNVYLCQLDHSSQKATGKDKLLYLQALHSFYKLHNLPHHQIHAVYDAEQMTMFQPSIDIIEQKISAAMPRTVSKKKAKRKKHEKKRRIHE